MMEQNLKVFVVDDVPSARMIARAYLVELGFQVLEFDSGAACLAALDEAPDILLLDVEMPVMDGIALCRAIRAADNTAHVIFISCHDDLDTRLQAYDAGGNDYIVKPYAPEELVRKLRVARQTLTATHELALQAGDARQTAFAAMSSMGEMGVVLEFLRAAFACEKPEQVADALLDALRCYELDGLLELRTPAGASCYSSQGACTPLLHSILGHVRTLERLFQFGGRLVVNYSRITLVVTLPSSDPDRAGRLRDHLAELAEGAELRLAAMTSESVRLAQAQSVTAAATELTRTLEDIDQHQQQHRTEILTIVDAHQREMERAFVHMGLTPRQEDSLVDMARQTTDRVSQLQDYSLSVGNRLRQVTAQLRRVVAEKA